MVMVDGPSTMEERESRRKSAETSGSSEYAEDALHLLALGCLAGTRG